MQTPSSSVLQALLSITPVRVPRPPSPFPLGPAARRLVRFLADFPRWHALLEVEQISLLERGDADKLPRLEALGLIESRPLGGIIIRVTPAGCVVADLLAELAAARGEG
ncbi:hypothetical protein ACE7GA_26325 [Roseomonas sp. CCTCC AB2023176]|uniref:hypothetical protein n=1 Tax=Roseomonas sp. CCTCC AB2023176 TaxID=3342640 RepID=UPI0035DD34A6